METKGIIQEDMERSWFGCGWWMDPVLTNKQNHNTPGRVTLSKVKGRRSKQGTRKELGITHENPILGRDIG